MVELVSVCLSPSSESKDSVRAPVQHNHRLAVTSLAGIEPSQPQAIDHLHRLLVPWTFLGSSSRGRIQGSYPGVVSRGRIWGRHRETGLLPLKGSKVHSDNKTLTSLS